MIRSSRKPQSGLSSSCLCITFLTYAAGHLPAEKAYDLFATHSVNRVLKSWKICKLVVGLSQKHLQNCFQL